MPKGSSKEAMVVQWFTKAPIDVVRVVLGIVQQVIKDRTGSSVKVKATRSPKAVTGTGTITPGKRRGRPPKTAVLEHASMGSSPLPLHQPGE